MADTRARMALALKQWWCRHEGRGTTFEVSGHCVVTTTICTNCGKGVVPHDPEAVNQQSAGMLRETFGRPHD